jgi:adenylate kinase
MKNLNYLFITMMIKKFYHKCSRKSSIETAPAEKKTVTEEARGDGVFHRSSNLMKDRQLDFWHQTAHHERRTARNIVCAFHRNTETMGGTLPDRPQQFLQLHVYVVSVVCIAGPDAVLAVHSDDER